MVPYGLLVGSTTNSLVSNTAEVCVEIHDSNNGILVPADATDKMLLAPIGWACEAAIWGCFRETSGNHASSRL